jgi:hypothetical protein
MLSGVFPGLGQLYVRAWGKGVAFLSAAVVVTWAAGALLSLDDLLAGQIPHPLATLGLVIVLLAVFLWSVVDAWRAAAGPQT